MTSILKNYKSLMQVKDWILLRHVFLKIAGFLFVGSIVCLWIPKNQGKGPHSNSQTCITCNISLSSFFFSFFFLAGVLSRQARDHWMLK